MINKVTKQECIEAIEYLHVQGFVDEMTSRKTQLIDIIIYYNYLLYNRL